MMRGDGVTVRPRWTTTRVVGPMMVSLGRCRDSKDDSAAGRTTTRLGEAQTMMGEVAVALAR
jgi:hypothetical protein